MKSVLCDINIFLDIFLKRQPYFQASSAVFKIVEEGKTNGYICSLSFPTLFYILNKELSREAAIKVLEKIRIVFKVAPVNEKIIDMALTSEFKDFEDAVQYYTAMNAKVDCVITRNKADFIAREMPILLPEEFLILNNSRRFIKLDVGGSENNCD